MLRFVTLQGCSQGSIRATRTVPDMLRTSGCRAHASATRRSLVNLPNRTILSRLACGEFGWRREERDDVGPTFYP